MGSTDKQEARGVLAFTESLFGGHRFPVFMLAALVLFEAVLVTLLLFPTAPDGLGAFAESFRTWCFGYDPATGRIEWAYVAMLGINPAMLVGVVLAVWWVPLRDVVRTNPRALVGPVLAAAAVVSVAAIGLVMQEPVRATGPLPLPADEIRTERMAPDFTLENQEGDTVALAELRGRVVVVTGVYASCGLTCPKILRQMRGVLDALSDEEKRELTVVGISLDPENDDRARLAEMAQMQMVAAPLVNFVGGEPGLVNRVLDSYGVSRRRDPETGIIDHANMFFVIDRAGRVAFTLTLGEQQERWLLDAIRHLLREQA